jgi:hypothetical protein
MLDQYYIYMGRPNQGKSAKYNRKIADVKPLIPEKEMPQTKEQLRLLTGLCLAGLSNDRLADFYGVSHGTIDNWMRDEHFLGAVKSGREHAMSKVCTSLYERAIGYSHRVEKVVNTDAGSHIIEIEEKFPPDVRAIQFFLHNRHRDLWRLNPDNATQEAPPPADPTVLTTEIVKMINSLGINSDILRMINKKDVQP